MCLVCGGFATRRFESWICGWHGNQQLILCIQTSGSSANGAHCYTRQPKLKIRSPRVLRDAGLVIAEQPLRTSRERSTHSCVSEASCAKYQAACTLGRRERRKIPAASLRSAPLHISKKGEQRCFCCAGDALPISAEGRPRKHTQRRPWRRRPETLRAKPSTFTKGAGGRQRAAHVGAVPGYPREHKGLTQNRDIH